MYIALTRVRYTYSKRNILQLIWRIHTTAILQPPDWIFPRGRTAAAAIVYIYIDCTAAKAQPLQYTYICIIIYYIITRGKGGVNPSVVYRACAAANETSVHNNNI